MGREQCTKYTVVFTRHCDRIYKKMLKKMDGRLRDQIDMAFKSLRSNPVLGKKLTEELEGCRSVRINEFQYRVVYEIDDARCWIIIHAVGHRSHVYDQLISYMRSHGGT